MAGSYLMPQVSGVSILGRFDQFDLFAGEGDIITSQAQAADGVDIPLFSVLVMDTNGRLTPWTDAGGHASVTGTFTGQPTAEDTITINGVAIAFEPTMASDFVVGTDCLIGATDVDTVANLVALINGTPDGVDPNTLLPTYGTGPLAGTGVRASLDTTGLVMTLTAVEGGTDGNAIVVAESCANFTWAGSATKLSGAEADHASGTLHFTATATNAQTVTINGQAVTFKTSGADGTAAESNIGSNATDSAQNLKAVINAFPGTFGCTAAGAGTTLTLTAIEEGLGGNAVTLAISNSNPVISGATLVGGGVSEPDVTLRPIGIAAVAVVSTTPGLWLPYFAAGVFNHEALNWPVGVATLAQRKRAFAGTDIHIGQLL